MAHYQSDMPKHFKFSVVRHPYDWTYSLYAYICRTNHPERNNVINKTFPKFVVYLRDVMMKKPWLHLSNNVTSQTVATKGCDKVYKLEVLEKDTTGFCNDIGVEYQALPFENSNPDRNIPYIYEADILIREIFADDYVNFGYE